METLTSKPAVHFTPEVQAMLLRAERDLNELLPLYDKADACGVDTSGFRAIRDQIISDITAIRKHFMPPAKPE